MFDIKDIVLYGTEGVCEITGTDERDFNGRQVQYYLLEPVFRRGAMLFVPIENAALVARMKKVMNTEEAKALLANLPEMEDLWVDSIAERRETYQRILAAGDNLMMLRIVKTLTQRQKRLQSASRRLHQVDERVLKDARRLLCEQLSLALDVPLAEAALLL
jgi:CarD family transcriptional regulator